MLRDERIVSDNFAAKTEIKMLQEHNMTIRIGIERVSADFSLLGIHLFEMNGF